MSQTMQQPNETNDELSEPQRRALEMGAVVHRRTRYGPFVSDIRVVGPLDVRELMGRCEPEDPSDRELAAE